MPVVQAAIDGLVYSGLYALLGLGFFLTFNVLRRIDLSYGTVLMASVYMSAMLASRWHAPWLAPFLACALAVGMGVLVSFVCFRLVEGDPRFSMAATLGVWMALEELVIQLPGHGQGQAIVNPLHDQVMGEALGLRLDHAAVLAAAVVIAVALAVFLRRTRLGLAIRTVSHDPDVAALMGMPRRSIEIIATILASVVGALAGYLFGATQQGIDVHFGMWVTLKGLVILFASGAGSVRSVVWAAVALGVGERVLTELSGPALRDLVGMGLLCVVIAVTKGSAGPERRA